MGVFGHSGQGAIKGLRVFSKVVPKTWVFCGVLFIYLF